MRTSFLLLVFHRGGRRGGRAAVVGRSRGGRAAVANLPRTECTANIASVGIALAGNLSSRPSGTGNDDAEQALAGENTRASKGNETAKMMSENALAEPQTGGEYIDACFPLLQPCLRPTRISVSPLHAFHVAVNSETCMYRPS